MAVEKAFVNNNTFLKNTIIYDYWGLGAEGELSAGLTFTLDKIIELTAIEKSKDWAAQVLKINQYRDINRSTYINPLYGFSIEQAVRYGYSALDWKIKFNDNVKLTSNNSSLFDIGYSSGVKYFSLRDESSYKSLTATVNGGGDLQIVDLTGKIYFNSIYNFPKEYFSLIRKSNSGLSSMVGTNDKVPLGYSGMINDMVTNLNNIYSSFNGKPIGLTTEEVRTQGFNLSFGLELDGALGIGYGIQLGTKLSLLDEISFPRKFTDIYANGENYLLYSSDYDIVMEDYHLMDMIKEVFYGAALLLRDEINKLLKTAEKIIVAGQKFVLNAYNQASENIGYVKGIISRSGKLLLTVISPESLRIMQKAFETPEVKNIYYSQNIYHKGDSMDLKSTTGSINMLILVSDVMNVAFIPTDSVKTSAALNEYIDLKLIINDDKLLNYDFSLDDKNRIKIYFYNKNLLGWEDMGGIRNMDTLTCSIINTGEYALGIETTDETDKLSPTIEDWAPISGSTDSNNPEIYAVIKDNKYGSGIDLSNSFLILNDEILDFVYYPSLSKISYEFPEGEYLNAGNYELKIVATDFNGNITTKIVDFLVTGNPTGLSEQSNNAIEYCYSYPNPFNYFTTIEYSIENPGLVEINIYDTNGRYIVNLENSSQVTGIHKVLWDGRNSNGTDLKPGIYYYQFKYNSINVVKPIHKLK
jgi:hypothetical protein